MSLVTQDELVQHFKRVISLMESSEHESYGGSITWEASETPRVYNVSGSYSINDYGGQGSVHIFQDGEDRT